MFVKHGTGKVLPDDQQPVESTSENWTEADQEALDAENESEDSR